jgi:heptosyltransferase-1
MGAVLAGHRLRRMQFDVVFDLQGFGETSVFAYLTGAPVRVGRVKNSPLRNRLYTVSIEADWEHEHRTRYFLKAVCEAFGRTPPASTEIPRLPSRIEPIEPSFRRVGLNLGASTASRRWLEQHFFRLAEGLSRRGFTLRLFLGPQEAFLFPSVEKMCHRHGWEFFSSQDLESLMKALSECHLLVSNDTGPGHLAAALDIPVITLFSTGSPENVGPMARKGKWFRNEQDINQITVSEVEKACLELLSRT